MKQLVLTALLLLLAAPGVALAQADVAATDDADHEAVRMAVLDYVEGIYEVAPERIERSVHPSLAKVGYWRAEDATTYREGRMTFEQLVALAGGWNKEGRVDAATARKDIALLDVMDQTATVKLSAHWGVDFMHLAKIDGKWMIMNVLWQSYPPDMP